MTLEPERCESSGSFEFRNPTETEPTNSISLSSLDSSRSCQDPDQIQQDLDKSNRISAKYKLIRPNLARYWL